MQRIPEHKIKQIIKLRSEQPPHPRSYVARKLHISEKTVERYEK